MKSVLGHLLHSHQSSANFANNTISLHLTNSLKYIPFLCSSFVVAWFYSPVLPRQILQKPSAESQLVGAVPLPALVVQENIGSARYEMKCVVCIYC